jgi:Family of unknown function (DUF6262)
VSTPRSLDGLRRSTDKRRTETRGKITKALREMRKKGLAINPHALAKYAGISRKSIYNHPALLKQIRAASDTRTPRPASLTAESAGESSVVAALREQLRTQKRCYVTEIAELKTQVKNLKRELAAAHGEIHRLTASNPSSKTRGR